MATNMEIRVVQKSNLFELLMFKDTSEKAGKTIEGFDVLISKARVAMEEEDIAIVEKEIAKLRK